MGKLTKRKVRSFKKILADGTPLNDILSELSRWINKGSRIQKRQMIKWLVEYHSLMLIRLDGINLECVDLSGLNLTGIWIFDSKLSGVNLSGAQLKDMWIFDSDLSGADLSGAQLKDALIIDVDLRGATLENADLSLCYAEKCNLKRANLRGAKLMGTKFESCFTWFADFEGAIYDNKTRFTDEMLKSGEVIDKTEEYTSKDMLYLSNPRGGDTI